MPTGAEGQAVTPLVRNAAAWSWRLLVILGAAFAVGSLIARLEVIVVPVALALMLSALLVPSVDMLERRIPRGLAVAVVLLGGFALLGGILAFVISQFVKGMPGLVVQVTRSIDSARKWLVEGPLQLSREDIDKFSSAANSALQDNQAKLTIQALSTAAAVTEFVTGALLVLFTLIFFLYGGREIWRFVTRMFPTDVQQKVVAAGCAGFGSLIGYVRATCLVALVDAVGIGAGLGFMGIPLALPLASLVFLGAFIPLVGAVIAGALAVVVALIAKGWVFALITLGLLITVQQFEGHVMQPLVMGRAVAIHPLGVVLGIASGAVVGGIPGALLAVPTIAFLNSAVRVLLAVRVTVVDPVASEPGPAPQDNGG
jgi:predicted PurR-regulated permease PerM